MITEIVIGVVSSLIATVLIAWYNKCKKSSAQKSLLVKELMKKLVGELCKDFPHVCADLYEIEGKVYFGEMTFTRSCGNIKFKSEGTDEHFGNLMTLPKEKYLFWKK